MTKSLPIAEIYRNLYPWRNLNQFVEVIKSTIVYKSEDNSVIAINKPFGVGTHTVHDNNTTKQNQDRILYQLYGSPRYCIQDALKPLSDELGSEIPYQVLKGIDRYMSGLTLLTTNLAGDRIRFKNAIAGSRASQTPPFGFRAITSGYPLIPNDKIKEKVGIELVEVDELGDYKEPLIVNNPSRRFQVRNTRSVDCFQVELEVKKVNKELSTALVELFVSKLGWDFARCYISSKTSFILGDVRFSKRIREVFGKPIQVSAFKSSHRYEDGYEPLNIKLRKVLGVRANNSVPLMLDHHILRLKNFNRKSPNKDLIIRSTQMPLHFAATADKFNLLQDEYKILD